MSEQAETPTESKHLPEPMPAVKLRRIDFDDDFTVAHPDEILTKARSRPMSMTLVLSVVFHVILLGLLSIGYIRDAAHYETIYPKAAKAEAVKQQRIEEKKAKAAEDAKKQSEAAAKAQAARPNATKTGKPVSKIEKELQETSNERPVSSDLDSIDDDL
ncbi:MAG: hypothetical protein ACI8W8_002079 [Rhodothermales bacterium]|jgi:hypothetical protein